MRLRTPATTAKEDGPAGLSIRKTPLGLRARGGTELAVDEVGDLLDGSVARKPRRLAVATPARLPGDRRHVELVVRGAQAHPADRSLADLFQVAVGYDGLANIAWSADLSSPGDGTAWFTHQTSGAIPGIPNDGCHSFKGGPIGGTGAKVTGAGSIAGTNGQKAKFGFNEPQLGGGNLTFVDKSADIAKFAASSTSPAAVSGHSASWSGTGTWTHADGSMQETSYQVTVVDGGSSGSNDRFSISFASYSKSGLLTGGNITIH